MLALERSQLRDKTIVDSCMPSPTTITERQEEGSLSCRTGRQRPKRCC